MDPYPLKHYADRLLKGISLLDWTSIEALAVAMSEARSQNRTVWICGNGGSAANAMHWANDFHYPVVKHGGKGLRINALSGNIAVVTCLGNDIGYDQIFSHQLETNGEPEDLLVVLSSSGNSPNILKALEKARSLGLRSFAIVGLDGGKAKDLADATIHFSTDDIQVAEDLQMVVCHTLVQYLAPAFGKTRVCKDVR